MTNNPPSPFCLLRDHEGPISALHFAREESNVIKNPTLISGSDIGEIFFWDLKIFRSYHKLKAHDGKRILYVCFHQSSLISQGRNGTVNIWSYEGQNWFPSKILQCSNYGFCPASIFSIKDFTYLIAPSEERYSLAFYDYKHKSLIKTIQFGESPDHGAKPMCMCLKVISYQSKFYLLAGIDDGHVILWDSELGKEKSCLKCHPEVVFCLDYDSVHRNRGISGSSDQVIQVWDIKDGSLNQVHSFSIAYPGVSTVKIRPDGKIVITGGQDGNIRVFSWKNLRPLAVLQFHHQEVVTFDFYMDKLDKFQSVFASGAKDKNISLWSIY